MNLPSLKGLRAVEAAIRLGSFTRAADELNVTQTAISRLVREVELWLGHTLFERRANTLELSESGRVFGPRLSDAFRELESAVASLQRRPGGPSVTVAVGPTFAMRWLIPRLPGFQRAHPGIEVRVVIRPSSARIGPQRFASPTDPASAMQAASFSPRRCFPSPHRLWRRS
jgi:LysR family glycine cleavage system transcriptional activator/LysR family transcriptional regulator of beta-lactamase